ncbi:hypothetical protein ACTMU2_38075 [Cupriavidus basilensis]
MRSLAFAALFAEKADHDRNPARPKGRQWPHAGQCRPVPAQGRNCRDAALAKFAAAPFGVVERFGELPKGKSPADYPLLLPVTLRNVEADLQVRGMQAQAGTVMKPQGR